MTAVPQLVAGAGWLATSVAHPASPALRVMTRAHVAPGLAARLDRLVAWSRACLELWFAECARPYIAYSGGKDSAVLLHVARAIRPGVEAMLVLDAEGSMPGVREGATWWRSQGATVHEFVWGAMLRVLTRTGRAQMDLRPVMAWARSQGFDGCARGLRAEESRGRRLHASTRDPVRVYTDRWCDADPLLWWTADDVWAYHALHQLPYAALYDHDDGVPRGRRRVGSPWGTVGLEHGRLARLKADHHALYQRLVQAAPDLRRFT